MNGTQHVLVGEKVIEPQCFNCTAKPADSRWVTTQLRLRIDDSDLHHHTLSQIGEVERRCTQVPR